LATIECLRNKAISAMLHEISGSAHVRDNHRQSAGLCFKDDVPKGIGRAGKKKEVRRNIGIPQLLTAQITSKQRIGQQALHLCQIRTIANNEWAHWNLPFG